MNPLFKSLVIGLASAALTIVYLNPSRSTPEPTQQSSRVLIAAPHWHTGQWWRIQVAQLMLSKNHSGIQDSPSATVVYRYQVLGKRTLTFEEQDGKDHVGQAVPPEACWLIVVKTEGVSRRDWPVSCHLYFRADDLSLREIAEPGGRQGTFYEYSSTHINDDEETKPALIMVRSPYRSELGPPVLDWPCFPLATSSAEISGMRIVKEIEARFNGADTAGAQVTLQSGKDTTTQVWLSGLPWWITADRNGLQQSRLIETSDHNIDAVSGTALNADSDVAK